jgi:hypothetical protein
MAWTGRSSGNEVTVAIAVKDGRAVAYVCDGKKVEAWLEGTLQGDQLSLQGKNGASLDGEVNAAAAFGTVAAKGASWPYSAEAVVAPAGLYEGRGNIDGVATRIGWIVTNDGAVTGLRQVADSPEPLPAPAFDPSSPDTVVVDGVAIDVRPIGGADAVIAR